MMNPSPQFKTAEAAAASAKAKLHGGCDATLAALAGLDYPMGWSMSYGVAVAGADVAKCLGRELQRLNSLEELLKPAMRRAIERLTDRAYA